ncbi:MAG: hypothetical protein JJ975_16560 [Bacteroidia bacterium]|nr:hypothetical protein [Bacteroidia bacterium]
MEDILDGPLNPESKDIKPNNLLSLILLVVLFLGFWMKMMHFPYSDHFVLIGLPIGLGYQLGYMIVLRGTNLSNNWLVLINVLLTVVLYISSPTGASAIIAYGGWSLSILVLCTLLTAVLVHRLQKRSKSQE